MIVGSHRRAASTPGAIVVLETDAFLILSGADALLRGLGFSILLPTGPGTYSIGPGGAPHGLIQEGTSTSTWVSNPPGGTGSVTPTSLTESRVAGTFHFTAIATNNAAPTTRTATSGMFDVQC